MNIIDAWQPCLILLPAQTFGGSFSDVPETLPVDVYSTLGTTLSPLQVNHEVLTSFTKTVLQLLSQPHTR